VNWVLIVVAVVAVVAVVIWFLTTRHQPENASSGPGDRRDVDAVGRGTQSPRNVDRPAGADAENMSADEPGGRTPPGEPDVRRNL
jgi:hypothetical protein